MNPTIAVIMDPIESISIKKDSTFAMLLEAQKRTWEVSYIEQSDIYIDQGAAICMSRHLKVFDHSDLWFEYDRKTLKNLADYDVILMRLDPPFDMEYIYTTYALDLAAQDGSLIVNHPTALRSFNEKLAVSYAPQCCAPFLVSRDSERIRAFIAHYRDAVIKPLDSMGGQSVLRLREEDDNKNAIIELLTDRGSRTVMIQKFIPEIRNGDKRVLLIDGEPIHYGLARIPKSGDFRGNLAAGGSYKGVELTQRDLWICEQLKSIMKENGLMFVGIDIIGDYLTEINVTSPTCIRELDAIFGLNIAGDLMDAILDKLPSRTP